MTKKENNVPVANLTSTGQAEQRQKDEKLKQYYLEQAQFLYSPSSTGKSENAQLETLLRKTKQIINMLMYFNRPWEDDLPELQKACLHFMAESTISQKERQRTSEKWGEWTLFLIRASRYHGLLTRVLEFYQHQRCDLEYLTGRNALELSEQIAD